LHIYLYLQQDKSYRSRELMIYLNLFIVPWSYFLYTCEHFLLLVPCNHQGSAIILSFKVWLSFAWIGINMWIQVNRRYFEIPQHHAGLLTSIVCKCIKSIMSWLSRVISFRNFDVPRTNKRSIEWNKFHLLQLSES
jgi:hypothetical protein